MSAQIEDRQVISNTSLGIQVPLLSMPFRDVSRIVTLAFYIKSVSAHAAMNNHDIHYIMIVKPWTFAGVKGMKSRLFYSLAQLQD